MFHWLARRLVQQFGTLLVTDGPMTIFDVPAGRRLFRAEPGQRLLKVEVGERVFDALREGVDA
jgi:hypothetical protein